MCYNKLLLLHNKQIITSDNKCSTPQPKGADRKHKTDREKMEKRPEVEKVSIRDVHYGF